MIKITNTVTRKREFFKALHPRLVLLYVCGVTPYDSAHIGHGRCYVSFDLLNRFLQYIGFSVVYCRNITDIDDKLLNAAQKEFGDQFRYSEIADRYIAQFRKNLQQLNCYAPSYEPRVTDHIPNIITFIEKLIAKGCAYVSDRDVYFDVRTFSEYGKLSKQKKEELRAGARVTVNDKKRDALDFALWKSEEENTFWRSPWGWGRPGWHIECSALARTYLGEQIDIHAGGLDLAFPHHENEIAQSEGLFEKPFANYWMHNGLVRVDGQKMSKSLGNFVTLDTVLSQYDPMIVRFYFLNHHYHAPMDFSFADLEAFGKSYQRLARALQYEGDEQKTYTAELFKSSEIVQQMTEVLLDDLNTPAMFGIVFDALTKLQHDPNERQLVKAWLAQVLGLELRVKEKEQQVYNEQVQKLINEREAARKVKDFKRADEIRDELVSLGVQLQDKKI